MSREYFVSLTAKQKGKWFSYGLVHGFSHHFIPVIDRPSSVLKAACRIFFRSAWSLQNTIKRHKCVYNKFSHIFGCLVSFLNFHHPKLTTHHPKLTDSQECRTPPKHLAVSFFFVRE